MGLHSFIGMSLVDVIKRLVDVDVDVEVAECEPESDWFGGARPSVDDAQKMTLQFVVHDYGELTKRSLWVATRPTRLDASVALH